MEGTQRWDVGYRQGAPRAENHIIGKHLTELVDAKSLFPFVGVIFVPLFSLTTAPWKCEAQDELRIELLEKR